MCARFDEFTTRPIEFRSVSDSTPRITLCNTDDVIPHAILQFRGCSLLVCGNDRCVFAACAVSAMTVDSLGCHIQPRNSCERDRLGWVFQQHTATEFCASFAKRMDRSLPPRCVLECSYIVVHSGVVLIQTLCHAATVHCESLRITLSYGYFFNSKSVRRPSRDLPSITAQLSWSGCECLILLVRASQRKSRRLEKKLSAAWRPRFEVWSSGPTLTRTKKERDRSRQGNVRVAKGVLRTSESGLASVLGIFWQSVERLVWPWGAEI